MTWGRTVLLSRDLGKCKFDSALDEATWKQACWARRLGVSLGSQQVLFLGQGELAKAELEDCGGCIFGFLDRWFR